MFRAHLNASHEFSTLPANLYRGSYAREISYVCSGDLRTLFLAGVNNFRIKTNS